MAAEFFLGRLRETQRTIPLFGGRLLDFGLRDSKIGMMA
jgi:hypothetical protein